MSTHPTNRGRTLLGVFAALTLSAGSMLAHAHADGAPTPSLSDSPYYKVRVAGARLLGARSAEDATAAARLRALTADPHPLVRATAASALGSTRLPADDRARLLADPDPLVRLAAR